MALDMEQKKEFMLYVLKENIDFPGEGCREVFGKELMGHI